MPSVQLKTRTIYLAPTSKRHYQTPRAAARAEARALLDERYPKEEPEYEQGRMIFSGYHWSGDEHLVKVHQRLARLILRQLRRHQDKES